MTAFDDALRITLGFEGGLANVKEDRGGPTMFGVTQAAYDRFRRTRKLPTRPVTFIDDTEVRTLYFDDYWSVAHCQELPERLACAVFDAAVNHGPGTAIRLLQRALDVSPDGIFGQRTREAVESCDEGFTIARLLDEREDFYADIIESDPTQAQFAKGWANRIAALRRSLEGMA